MALSIKSPEADRLARRLAELTGEGLTETVVRALEERLRRVGSAARGPSLRDELARIRRRCAAMPVRDPRSPEEILGYDDRGLPR